MSKISRQVFQKLAEENKKLKADLETLVMRDDLLKAKKTFSKWHRHFSGERAFEAAMKQIAREHFEKHKDEFPYYIAK